MGDKSGIEWTDSTWNPTTGCDQVSPGCDHCYAMSMAKRLKTMGQKDYQTDGNPRTSGEGFGIAMHPHRLDQPLRWTRPRKIFVNSMSDLFHSGVTVEFIAEVFAVMSIARQHTFQVLTKRHGRMRAVLSQPGFHGLVQGYASRHDAAHVVQWPLPNVVLGVSVEDQQRADIRIPALLDTPATVRFLSMEPLLGPVNIEYADWAPESVRGFPGVHNPLTGEWWPAVGNYAKEYDGRMVGQPKIDWVIVGGESGRGARPMHPDWVRSLRDQCTSAGVPFLFKQWGE